jgi:hypothetical protein
VKISVRQYQDRPHVEQVDPVVVVGDALEVLECGPEQRAHAVVVAGLHPAARDASRLAVFEVEVLVRAGGHLDHPVEELALRTAVPVVIPLVLEN